MLCIFISYTRTLFGTTMYIRLTIKNVRSTYIRYYHVVWVGLCLVKEEELKSL